ncbi:MAG: hypothetical protein ACRCX8_03750, partial [Sarcina sp.]
MSEVKVNIDLDLDTQKAKGQLDEFKNKVKDDKVPIKLDIENVKEEALSLKRAISNAFKLDDGTLGNLKQVESTIKQINVLLKNQSNLVNKSNNDKNNELISTDNSKKAIEDIEKNTSKLEQALKNQYEVINKDYKNNTDLTISGINEQELSKMKEFIRLSQLMGKASKENGNMLSPDKSISQYLALSKQIDAIQTKIYKTGTDGKDASALVKELELLEKKRNQLNDLIDVNSKYMQQELKLQQARKNSNVAAIDSNEKVKDLKAEQKATE